MSKALTWSKKEVKGEGHGAAQEWFLPVPLSDYPKAKLPSWEYLHQAVTVSIQLSFDQALVMQQEKYFVEVIFNHF